MTDPFQAAPAAPGPSEGTITCARCSAVVPAATASYSDEGEQICKQCEALATIDVGDSRAANSIIGGGVGAFMLGLVSICFNPLLAMSVIAILTGVGTILMVVRHPEYRARMGWRYPATIALSVIGILMACVIPGVMLLGLLAAAAVR